MVLPAPLGPSNTAKLPGPTLNPTSLQDRTPAEIVVQPRDLKDRAIHLLRHHGCINRNRGRNVQGLVRSRPARGSTECRTALILWFWGLPSRRSPRPRAGSRVGLSAGSASAEHGPGGAELPAGDRVAGPSGDRRASARRVPLHRNPRRSRAARRPGGPYGRNLRRRPRRPRFRHNGGLQPGLLRGDERLGRPGRRGDPAGALVFQSPDVAADARVTPVSLHCDEARAPCRTRPMRRP